jgi:putative intracellular protease/amidase
MSNHRVLFLVTSHDQMGDTGQKTGFWLEEVATPYYSLLDAGCDITVASPKGGQAPIDPTSQQDDWQTGATRRFEGDAETKDIFANTVQLSSVKADDFDAVFVPGGHGPMWDYPGNPIVKSLLEGFHRQGKIIAAVCHGPACLVDLTGENGEPLVKGKTLTAFTDSEETAVGLQEVVPFMLETRLRELGANFVAAGDFTPQVHSDGLLITGQNPQSSEPAAAAVLAALNERQRSAA